MKQISFSIKQYIFILGAGISMMFLQGCGGGTPGTEAQITEISQLKNIRISIAGSSITNGENSYLGAESYVGKVEEYLREEKATTLRPGFGLSNNNLEIITDEPLCYKEELYKYSGIGTTITGTLTGDEISLAYAKERGNRGAAMIEFSVDGVIQETFSTYDTAVSVHTGNKNFTGNGTNTLFDLGEAFTFNHVIRLNGASTNGHINDELNGADNITPEFGEGEEWMIIRKVSNNEVHHFILFETPPTNNSTISASFKYGESIKTGKSTIGNLTQFIGSGTESPFGDGGVTYDVSNPQDIASGLDFRETDRRAIKTWKFDDNGLKNFTFTIKEIDDKASGTTPEFFINFVTNRMHYVQNAGIGGFKASDFLATSGLTTTKQIIDFAPNIFILESATNDANYRANLPTTNEWIIRLTDECIINPNSVKFTATDKTPEKGDVLIIGGYIDNIDDVAVRVIENWDAQTKIVKFLDKINVNDYNLRCQIKRIQKWEDNVEAVVNKVKQGVGSPLFVGIGTSGVPNLTDRKLAGYKEKGELLAIKLNAKFIDFYQKTYDFNGGIRETNTMPAQERWSLGDNTHLNDTGRTLFGEAITEELFGR